MRLYYLNEETGEYCKAGKKEILAAGQEIARLQHLKPVISSASAFIDYLKLQMQLLPTEQFRVVYLNNQNRIIGDDVLSEGVEDQTSVYPKKIVRECLMRYATGVIVTHNHPTGQLTPSSADRGITKAIAAACDTLEIRFLDHIIIGTEGNGYFSFRENGLL